MVFGKEKAFGYHALRPRISVFYDQRYLKIAGKSSAIASSISIVNPFKNLILFELSKSNKCTNPLSALQAI